MISEWNECFLFFFSAVGDDEVKKSEGKQVEGIFGLGKKDKDKSKDKVKTRLFITILTIETPVSTGDLCCDCSVVVIHFLVLYNTQDNGKLILNIS